jgi:hypothetical protein
MTSLAGTKMTVAKFALTAIASAVTVIALPAANAQADSPQSFVSPSGNIVCGLGTLDGKASATCEIRDYSFTAPHCTQGGGNEFGVTEGEPAAPRCHTDTNFVPGRPILQYGQSRSAGPITCDSEPSGMTCTDKSTGHFFRVSRESYQLG